MYLCIARHVEYVDILIFTLTGSTVESYSPLHFFIHVSYIAGYINITMQKHKMALTMANLHDIRTDICHIFTLGILMIYQTCKSHKVLYIIHRYC